MRRYPSIHSEPLALFVKITIIFGCIHQLLQVFLA
jgi:hypothetical protein